MHSSAVCNLFSKRWSGSICEHLGGKARFGHILKYIVYSAASMKHSIKKKRQKIVNKNMSWLLFFFHIDIQLWWITQEVNHCSSWVSNTANFCTQSWVTESGAGKMNTAEGLCQPDMKPQENWVLLHSLLWTWLCFHSTKGCSPFSPFLSWNRGIFRVVRIYLEITESHWYIWDHYQPGDVI